jgi:lysozyme family protein
MNGFEQALALTLRFEGGYANDPSDPGGETYCGIARNRSRDWIGWLAVDALKGEPDFPRCLARDQLLQSDVRDFYRKRFWLRLACDQMPDSLASVVFDTAVHCGPERAARWFQAALSVEPDGVVGPKTLEAARDYPAGPKGLARAVIEQRRIHYAVLGPWADRFRKGWENRVSELETLLA